MGQKKKHIGLKILIGALVFIIPVAVVFFILTQNQYDDLSHGNITALTLRFEGAEEKRTEEKADVDFFVSAMQSGESIKETAAPLEEYRLIRLSFHKINHDVEYRLYLSDSVNDCVYATPDGALHLIPKATAAELLAHPLLGRFAYSYASVPLLQIKKADGTLFDPAATEGEWSYLAGDGTKKQNAVKEATDAVATLPKGEALVLEPSLKPDYCTVLLTAEDGRILYDGTPERMELLDLSVDQFLTLSVTCDWYEDSHEDYYGSLRYTFRVFYDVPTLCKPVSNEVAPGESVVVEVFHSSADSIAVTATLPTGGVTTEKKGDGWLVTIPVLETAPAGEYTITLLGSDVDESLTVSVLK